MSSRFLNRLGRFFWRALHDRSLLRMLLEHRLRKAKSLGCSLTFLPFRSLAFGEIHWTTEIGPYCEFRSRRNIFLSRFVQIRRGVVLQASTDGAITIGARTQISPYTTIFGRVEIGSAVLIAPHVMIAAGNHNFSRIDVPIMDQGNTAKGIRIEDDVWIGANSVILDGVTIRHGAIVAAGTVVTNDVETFSVVAGVPAQKKRVRQNP